MDFGVDICLCGHPVHKHALAHTEYARCEGSNTLCRCEGWVRTVGVGYGNVSRYFRREVKFLPTGEYVTLNKAIDKCWGSEETHFIWSIKECDTCGQDIGDSGTPLAFGTPSPNLTVKVLCGICQLER